MGVFTFLGEHGFNLSYLIAGFSGGLVSLVFVHVERGPALLTILAGALVANYLTAAAQFYLKFPAATELGVAFIVGICAIRIVRGIYRRGDNWAQKDEVPQPPPQQ